MAAFTRGKVSNRKLPFEANKVGSATFTIGTETSNARTVAVQLKDETGQNLTVRAKVRGYLAGDANGDTLHASAPTGGVQAGTDGLVINQVDNGNAVVVKGTLAISGVAAEKFKTTTTAIYRIGGVIYTKAATDNLVFTAAHVVGAAKYGIVLVQINAAGTISTKVPLTPQVYTSAALALAALPLPDAGNVMLGYVTLDNSGSDGSTAGAWTANTDDMTDTGDITDSGFVDAPEVNSSRSFEAVSESDGDLDVVITETGVKTFYLVLEMPNGGVSVSSAIAFA